MTHIAVVGAGALGSHLVLFARNLDARFTVIDFDRIEQKNVYSQFHTKMGVGRNKAQALRQAVHGLFGSRVEAIPHRLTVDNAEALLAGADLLVDCVDHGPTRALLAEIALARGVPCLHGALAADGAYARLMWAPRFRIDEVELGGATCEDGEHLPFIALVAARMAHLIQQFLGEGVARDLHLRPDGLEAL